jgi:FlaA1/EpsC-like NDP-sugar epimerase
MLELTFKRRLFEVTLDFFLISLTYYLAFLTGYNFQIDEAGLQSLLVSFPIVLGCVYFFFFVFGVYKRLWRYLGTADLLVYLQATVFGVFSAALILSVISKDNGFPPGIFLLFGIYLFLGLAASRGSFKILDVFSSRQVTQSEERVLICGAGDAGEMALRWILMNPQLNFLPVGIIDQDPYLLGKQIHGVMVIGDIAQLPQLLEQKKIAGVIVTDNVLQEETLGEKIISSCSLNGCWVRNLRLEFELVE